MFKKKNKKNMQKESKAIWNTFWVDPISRYLLYEKRTFCRRIRKFLFKYAKIFTFWFLSAYISIIFTRNYSLFLNIFPYLWSHVPERFFFSFYSLFVLADLLGEFIFIFFPLSLGFCRNFIPFVLCILTMLEM